MRLTLTRLWVDNDEMLEIEVYLNSGRYAATQAIYLYPESLKKFGQKLQGFPTSVSDETVLEIGSTDEKDYCWFKLRAYVYDGSGHTAIELSVKKNGAPLICAQSQFSVPIEAASLNNLGKQIEAWATNNEEPLIFEVSNG